MKINTTGMRTLAMSIYKFKYGAGLSEGVVQLNLFLETARIKPFTWYRSAVPIEGAAQNK